MNARAATLAAILGLVTLVGVRAWVFVVEGVHFDSDQAVIGIMANDLAQGRAVPFFTYGRVYMLAISAWLSAPLFALFGTSVALLKLPLALLNVALVAMLWVGLRRSEGASPGQAFLSILPVALPAVAASSRLVEQGGGNIEPFVFLTAAFLIRDRPIALGALLGFAALNREFTLIGFIALLLMDLFQRRLGTRWRKHVLSVLTLVAVNLIGRKVAELAPNYFGPRVEVGSFSLDNIAGLFEYQLPRLFGAATSALDTYNIRSSLRVGHGWLAWLIAGWLACVVAVLALVQRLRRDELDGIATYLVLCAGGQGLAFILYCSSPFDPMLMRYVLILLLGATGIIALALKRPLLRALTAAVVVTATLANLRDHVAVIHEYATRRPFDPHAALAAELMRRDIEFARADNYWVAYHVSFLTGERVVVTAPADERIDRYRQLVSEHSSEAWEIKQRCKGGGIQVARWQLCRPKRRR